MHQKPVETEFDQYEAEYRDIVEGAMSFSGMRHDYVTRVKADHIVAIASREFGALDPLRILDVGCGIGLTDSFLDQYPWKVDGTDVSKKSIDQAKLRNPAVAYGVGEVNRLPYSDESFDLCFTICVMHHVVPEQWTDFLREMRRVLKPGGVAVIFEHNPLNPLTQLVVSRIPFDADAVLLSQRTLRKHLTAANLTTIESRYFLFTPWQRTGFVDRVLGWCPMGAQYYVTARKNSAE